MILDAIKEIKNNFNKEPLIIEFDENSAKDIIKNFNHMGLSAEAFAEETKLSEEAMISYLKITDSGKATFTGYKNHVDATNKSIGLTGIKAKAASIWVGLLNAALSVGISLLAGFVIEKVISGIDYIIHYKEKLAEAAETAKNNIDELKSSFDNLEESTNNIKKRYAELAQGVDQFSGKNLSLSDEGYDEFLNLSNQLAELFPTLTKNYDENGNAILNLSGNVNSIVSSLDDLIERQRELSNQEMLENLPDIYKNYTSKVDGYSEKLDEAQKKQEDYLNLYNQLKNAEYEVSDDKKAVTFHFGNISEKEEAELAKELTSSFEDAHDFLIQEIGTLDNHDSVITLYLEKEFNGFEARLRSAQDEISKYSSMIKTEVSSFSSYMNTWLEGSWAYQQQDETMQKALQQVLFNKDWIDIAKSALGEDAEWEDISNWIEDKYIYAISNINDEKIKQDFLDLFTTDLTPQAKLDLAQKLQEYFDNNEILVSLGFILNEEDPNSTQNIVDRFNASRTRIAAYDPEGYLELKEYTEYFDEAQMRQWLKITEGIVGADNALKEWKESLKNSSDYDNFFTDTNLEAIDEYKSKISDLSGYLKDIDDDGKLSADNLSKLNTEYGIAEDSVEGYRNAIVALMNKLTSSSNIMVVLKEAIESCDDAILKSKLQSLYDSLDKFNIEAQESSQSIYSLKESVSQLESSAALLRELNKLMSGQGFIDKSKANDILEVFPNMEKEVAKFNAGLIDSQELFDLLVEAYETDEDNYAKSIAIKNQYSDKFYDNWLETLPDWVKDMAESYGIDLENYENLNEQKLALDKEYARRKAAVESALETSNKMNEIAENSSEGTQMRDQAAALSSFEDYMHTKRNLEEFETLLNGIEDSFTIDTDWKEFGKNESDSGNGNDSDNITEIDWADQSLKVLQDEVDKLQTTLDNTKGLDNQIDAIDNLNGALEKLKGGYQSAYDEYEQRYKDTVSKLGEDIRKKIESGEEFDLSKYDSDTAEDIQNSIDYFNKMAEAEAKIVELSNQIDFNDNIEKSKLLQQSYELKLETINTKLEDQTLSVDEKNALLDEQLRLQIAINELLREQAKYEGDYETISKLDAEDKNRKLQERLEKLRGKREQNQVYIDTYNEKLEDTTLTSDEIDKLNNGLQSVTNRDFKYQFKEKIKLIGDETWDDYIKSLKKKYSEQDMSDKKFIKKHLGEISNYFSHTGMEELYYEYLSSERGFEETDYETKKNERNYHLNDTNNNIQDIQNDIELQGGRGTEEQYKDLENLYRVSKDYWTQQKSDAEAMRDNFTPFTAEWDKWNNEVQECDDNIHNCDSSIKDCEMSILKLPLNYVEDSLRDIENKLNDINRELNDKTELISAATGILDNEIYTNEILKETIQDQIDKLEKENSLRQSSLNIQKAEYALRRAEEQRSNKVFVAGKGWEYQSDQDEINEAQYNYDNAKYEHKLALLNDHVKVYDEEIKRLNKIKDRWSRINTEAENLVLINKALLYDKGFIGKVLEEDANFMVGISSAYSSLLSQKDTYEDQQEDYTTLQDIINDTVEMYNLEAIGYEEAKQRIKNAIVQYYPEIVSNYENEEETLDRVAKKKLEDAGITETTSTSVVDTVKKSNKKLLKSYKKLAEGMDDVFVQLNGMLDAYSENTQAMINTISASIESLRHQLAAVQSEVSNTTVTTEVTTSVESSSKKKTANKKKKNKKEKSAGKSHSGLELGYIGESSNSKDKEAFKYIALSELKNDEVVRILQQGEAVLTNDQIHNVMDNFRKLTQIKVPTLLPNNMQNQSVSFTGDIVINNPVGDSSKLAREIKQNFGNTILQELYK